MHRKQADLLSICLASKLREFELATTDVTERIAVIEQGALSLGAQAAEMGRMNRIVAQMRK